MLFPLLYLPVRGSGESEVRTLNWGEAEEGEKGDQCIREEGRAMQTCDLVATMG